MGKRWCVFTLTDSTEPDYRIAVANIYRGEKVTGRWYPHILAQFSGINDFQLELWDLEQLALKGQVVSQIPEFNPPSSSVLKIWRFSPINLSVVSKEDMMLVWNIGDSDGGYLVLKAANFSAGSILYVEVST